MSDAENADTAVLLPGARLWVFTRDSDTVKAVGVLRADWRFARVEVELVEGDVETAIETFQSRESPDIMIVQTDEITDSFPERLETLAGHCKEDTAAIVIGPVNDVYLYRKLVGMGVNDYLVRPVNPEVLCEVIAKSLIERIGAIGSHLIAVVGAKGGVGVSALAQALSWGASDILRQKTILLDAAGGWSSASVGVGFEPAATLAEAIRAAENEDEASLNRMLFKPTEKLSVLATGIDAMLDHSLIPDQLENMLDMLMTKFPVVIVDLSQAPSIAKRSVLARAHRILLVSTATLPSLRLARTLMGEVKQLRGGSTSEVDLVINMQGLSSVGEVPKADIEAAMECKPAAFISFNPKLFLGLESQSRKATADKGGMEIVNILLPLIREVVGVEAETGASDADGKGGIGGLLSRFKSKG